jgi:hypothetical protein
MKATLLTFITVFSMATLLSFGVVCAQDSGKAAEETKSGTTDKMEGMNMEGMDMDMDMDHMSGMKNDCMKEHKNKKMCHDQMMKKCEEKMGKADCSKMMKDMDKKKHK